jgi:hypothetical protein
MYEAKQMVKFDPWQRRQRTETYRTYQTNRRTPSMRGGGADWPALFGTRWQSGGDYDRDGTIHHGGAGA